MTTEAGQTQTTQTTQAAGTQAAAAAQVAGAAAGSATTTTQATTGTVLDDGGQQTQQAQQTNVGAWRDDWRVAMAKGDEKVAKRLERYASPEAVTEALIAAQTKISSGQIKTPLPKDATPEQVAAWRADNGIPESPDKYDFSLPNGLVIGEADKPIVDGFAKFAHDKNWTPDKVKEGLEWYYQYQDQAREQTTLRDAENRKKAEDALREEWGQEYRINQRVLKEHLDAGGLTDKLVGARYADGTLVLADPDTIRWLVAEARDKNPIASVMPGGGGNSLDAATTELAKLRGMMADYNSAYWKGPESEKLQARYRDLTDAVERQKTRAA